MGKKKKGRGSTGGGTFGLYRQAGKQGKFEEKKYKY